MRGAPPCYYDFFNSLGTLNVAHNRLIQDVEEVFGIRVYPLPEVEFRISSYMSAVSSRGLVRGAYNPYTKTTILTDGAWCRKTFLHEILHSLSSFCRVHRSYELKKLCGSEFSESLTEFFTGYVLYKKYRHCYDEWVREFNIICRVSYKPSVRLFGAAAQVLIPLSEFARIYFYDPGVDWLAVYGDFLNRHSLDDFLLNRPKGVEPLILFEQAVRDAIRVKFGPEKLEEFEELRQRVSLDEVLDYSRMKI